MNYVLPSGAKAFTAKQRIAILIAIMIALTLIVISSLTFLLFQTSIEQQKERLLTSVKSQARIIEAFTNNANFLHDDPHNKEHIYEVLLTSIREAHEQYEGFGQTGEFVLARLEGSQIHFLLSHRHGEIAEPPPVAIASDIAEPMRQALSGNSGTIIGLDYRGASVVAAYEFIGSLDIGVVAKIDLDEVKLPFYRSAATGLLIALVCIGLSVGLFYFVIMPVSTQIERQAKKLNQINERMTIAAESIEMGIWDWNIAKNRLVWDTWMFKLYGLNPEDFTGAVDAWEKSLHPEDFKNAQQAIQHAIDTRSNFHGEFRIVRPNGDIRHIKADAVLIVDATNKPVKMIGVNVDVTEKVHLEEKLKRSGRLEAIGKLAGGIAHDFNNLLAIMSGRLELLVLQLQDNGRDEFDPKDDINHVMASIDRGKSLTKRLLIFSRSENTTAKVLSAAQLLQNTEEMLRRTLDESITLTINVGDDVGNITVDEHQFENALINLSLNAHDAMEKGGALTIKVSNEDVESPRDLYSQTLPAGRYVVFSVKDTGSGIPTEAIDQIFEPFFSTKSEENGTGLGLCMVYGFVTQYKGYVNVNTTANKGTEFLLYFPLTSESPSKNQSDNQLPILPASDNGNILVVEDNQNLLDVTKESLQIQGYNIITAVDANEALDIIQSGTHIDLLFSDIVLPGDKKGTDIAEELHHLSPEIPVILTTGYTPDLQINADFHLLAKPYTRSELLKLIDLCLQQRMAG